MKHSASRQDFTNRETLADRAQDLLAQLGVSADRPRILLACDYLLRILEANRIVNLTAVREPLDALRLHIVDSLAVLPELLDAPAGALCDIGSGGGFPGVPLCIVAGRDGVLLDSAGRKVDAVARSLAEAGVPNIEVRAARAEEYAREAAGSFSVVTARAVAELPVLVEYAGPLLAAGGSFIAMKGSPSKEEIDRGRRAASLCGLSLVSARVYTLPGGGERRESLRFVRMSNASVALPRAVGRAAKRPLA